MFISKRNQRRIRKMLWKHDLELFYRQPFYYVMVEDLIRFERAVLEDEIDYALNKRGFTLRPRMYHGIMHYCEHEGMWEEGLGQYGEEEKVFFFLELDYMKKEESE